MTTPDGHLALPAAFVFVEGPTHAGAYWATRCECGWVSHFWRHEVDLRWERMTHLAEVSVRDH